MAQEAYLRAYRGLPGFRGDAHVRTWLYRIIANCAARHLGRRRRRVHAALDDVRALADPGAPDPSAAAGRVDLRREIEAAIADLPPRLRHVVVLRDVYDLPHEVIAAELGISTGAAKVRLHRARKVLRDRLFGHREAAGAS